MLLLECYNTYMTRVLILFRVIVHSLSNNYLFNMYQDIRLLLCDKTMSSDINKGMRKQVYIVDELCK